MATQNFRLVTMKSFSTLQQQQGIKPVGARAKTDEHWIRLSMAWEYRAMLLCLVLHSLWSRGQELWFPVKDRSGIHNSATQNTVWRESHWFHGHGKCWNLGSCETASKCLRWLLQNCNLNWTLWISGRKRKRFSECLVCTWTGIWSLLDTRGEQERNHTLMTTIARTILPVEPQIMPLFHTWKSTHFHTLCGNLIFSFCQISLKLANGLKSHEKGTTDRLRYAVSAD